MAALYGDMLFNIDHGYLEGLVRGFRSGILTRTDYLNLIQCETLEGEFSTINIHKCSCFCVLNKKVFSCLL